MLLFHLPRKKLGIIAVLCLIALVIVSYVFIEQMPTFAKEDSYSYQQVSERVTPVIQKTSHFQFIDEGQQENEAHTNNAVKRNGNQSTLEQLDGNELEEEAHSANDAQLENKIQSEDDEPSNMETHLVNEEQPETELKQQTSDNAVPLKAKKQVDKMVLDVPLINQMDHPRLYNGCEVTSLTMILNYKGISVSKNDLANEIKRVPFRYENGQRGNPNEGFVGNMEDGPGLGVYHGPLLELAQQYVGNRARDLTGKAFDLVLEELAEENPIWVIVPSRFVPVSNFSTWDTPQGPVDVTFSMHSVVITGFDEDNVYINDPYGAKNRRVNKDSFIKAWEQMGSQAIVIY